MKQNYYLVTLLLTLIVNTTTIKAVDFLAPKSVLTASSTVQPTEEFYTQLTSVPYESVDSVDMTNSTLAPSYYYSCFTNSYPTKGFKIVLGTAGTITLRATSVSVSVGNYALIITKHYTLTDYEYLCTGIGTSNTLAAGTYYIALLTNQKYGKFKLNVSSTATITTELGSTENNQIQLYSKNNSIIANGINPKSVIKVYNISGQLLKSVVSSSNNEEIAMPNKGIYIVKVNDMSKKITIL